MAHLCVGSLLKAKGDRDGASAAYQKSIDVAHDRAEAYFQLGFTLSKLDNDLDGAIAAYRESIRLKSFWSTYYNLGRALATQGNADEAIAAYRDAIRLKPDYMRAHTNLANLLQQQGRIDEAIDCFREIVRLNPNSGGAHFDLGYALDVKGLIEEAIIELRESVRLEPVNSYHQYSLGRALMTKGLVDEAITALRESINLGPVDPDTHYWLARELSKKGSLDEAIAEYRVAIRLQPDDAYARDELATHLNNQAWRLATHPEPERRDPVRAVTLAKDAVELKPEKHDYWNTLGAAHYRAGNWKEVVTPLQKSLELRGDNSFDFFFLAMAHWQLGDKDQARKWCDQAVGWMDKNQPKDEELLRFRAEAEELMKTESGKKPE